MENIKYAPEEPICAIATALAPSALGIIRCSGKNSISLVSKIFSRPKALLSAAGNTLVYGWILFNNSKIDEVMLGVYRAPKSFTGEDMVEIYCHGGPAVVTAIQNLMLKSGFRQANRGEYTFRAYINGKTDLTKAEAVKEIIDSHTDVSRSHAAGRLSGELFNQIDSIKKLIIDTLAAIEVEIEYPEDEEMLSEIEETANSYYKMYEQYYGYTKEQFLSENNFGSERAFLEYLKLPYRRSKYAKDYVNSLVTESEINKYYEEKVYGDIDTKHILVATSDSSTDEEKEKANALAKEIIEKLNKGATFDEVKEEYKDSITYEELGYKPYNASLESSYMEEMKKLENNAYSKEPVKTSYGYHIVYRIDQKEKPALEDVKEEIIESLGNEKLSKDSSLSYKALEEMRKEANLTFTDTDLESKYKTYLDNLGK